MERILEVHLEIDPVRLAREKDPTRTIAQLSRQAAEDKCAADGARLRHPDPQEVDVKTAMHPLTGDDVLLVATRWVADSPAA